jgi:hypothetical protein
LRFCYSYRAWRYPSAFLRQVQNTLLIKTAEGRELIRAAWMKLKNGITVRLYVDGDIDSAETLRFWMGLCKARPDLQVYGYSKSWALFIEADNAGMVWPSNYLLNFSGGSRYDGETLARLSLIEPIKRGEFLAVNIEKYYHPEKKMSNAQKYADPAYHAAVRAAAKAEGLGPVFSCPGSCGDCTPAAGHACGSVKFQNVRIVIGIH